MRLYVAIPIRFVVVCLHVDIPHPAEVIYFRVAIIFSPPGGIKSHQAKSLAVGPAPAPEQVATELVPIEGPLYADCVCP